jgi:hypothetical protein
MEFQRPSSALAWSSRRLRLLWHGIPEAFVRFGMEFQRPSSALAWNSRGLRLLWHGIPEAFVCFAGFLNAFLCATKKEIEDVYSPFILVWIDLCT